jgi:hypothetical protein
VTYFLLFPIAIFSQKNQGAGSAAAWLVPSSGALGYQFKFDCLSCAILAQVDLSRKPIFLSFTACTALLMESMAHSFLFVSATYE